MAKKSGSPKPQNRIRTGRTRGTGGRFKPKGK